MRVWTGMEVRRDIIRPNNVKLVLLYEKDPGAGTGSGGFDLGYSITVSLDRYVLMEDGKVERLTTHSHIEYIPKYLSRPIFSPSKYSHPAQL
jgi:hypothetical protein